MTIYLIEEGLVINCHGIKPNFKFCERDGVIVHVGNGVGGDVVKSTLVILVRPTKAVRIRLRQVVVVLLCAGAGAGAGMGMCMCTREPALALLIRPTKAN